MALLNHNGGIRCYNFRLFPNNGDKFLTLINPATIDIVFSRRAPVHGKAALRRRSHSTASNANTVHGPARGGLSFQINWLGASGPHGLGVAPLGKGSPFPAGRALIPHGPEALNTISIVAGLIKPIACLNLIARRLNPA